MVEFLFIILAILLIIFLYIRHLQKEIKFLEKKYNESRDEYWDRCAKHHDRIIEEDEEHLKSTKSLLAVIKDLESKLGKFTSCNLYLKK